MKTYSKLHLVDIRVGIDIQKNYISTNSTQKNAVIEIIEILLFVGEHAYPIISI